MDLPIEKVKAAATVVIVLIALAMAYYFIVLQGPGQPSLKPGNEINLETFASVLSDAPLVYIVMDVRNAANATKQNILLCGVDFAGSTGLADKNLTFYSLDKSESCIGQNGNYSSSWCFSQFENGVTILVQPGNSTKFYTNAMVVGVGENYTSGECSVKAK